MALAVARQERDVLGSPAPEQDVGGGFAVMSVSRYLLLEFELGAGRIQAAAADNRQHQVTFSGSE